MFDLTRSNVTTTTSLGRVQFTAMFENRLEKRVLAEGLTVEEFYDWLKADLEEDSASNNAFIVSGDRQPAQAQLVTQQAWLISRSTCCWLCQTSAFSCK
jgi:hypothetical protein